MATATLAPPRRGTRHRVLRFIFGLVVLVLVVVAGAAFWFWHLATAALPQVDGTVQVSGLSAPVTVARDAQGVPHIKAANLEDLLEAQGYVAAQDRLWEMDTLRRFAAGELSEVLGAQLLPVDRTQRTLQLRYVAEHTVESFTPDQQHYIQAYARGVNAFIDTHQDSLPIEFRLLKYKPRRWEPKDSLLIGLMMEEMLNHGLYRTALSRELIVKRLGPELAKDLYPNASWRDKPPSAKTLDWSEPQPLPDDEDDNGANVDDDTGVALLPAASREFVQGLVADTFDADGPLVPGSNNWVVSGAHTASGKPLLSNDMHLEHQIPGIWYEAHLQAQTPATFNVAGVTIPGAPFVIVGHNARIAWGFTNLGPSVEDVFVENFQNGKYQTPSGWQAPEHRREVIHVKGAADVVLDVVLTRHGPIITDLVNQERRQAQQSARKQGITDWPLVLETRQVALQWGIYSRTQLGIVFVDVDQAQNWEEFRRAFSHFAAPGQNVVYGDVDGHIGYQATGAIPIRAAGDGSLPVSGADDAHEWVGTVTFDKLPSVYDPPSGILATANGRIVEAKYPYLLSTEWFAPYRTERIYRVLQSGRKFVPADMLALQTDIYSDFDHVTAEQFVSAVDHAAHPSARARQAADLLRGWDARITTDSVAATINSFARKHLYRLLLEPKLGPDYHLYSWGMQSVALENILEHKPARWLPPQFKSYDELLTAALEAGVNDPAAPKDLSTWTWGKQFPLELQHPILGPVPLLSHWTGPGTLPQSGSGYTVKQVGRSFGPSERMTVDFSNLDGSTLNIVTGQSGQVFSPHYMDQWQAWYTGTTFTLPFTDSAVAAAREHELTLKP